MYVIEVIPLEKGIRIESLSYFSGEQYRNGTLLRVPVRNKEILGVVTNAREVSTTKTALKAATFSLKKLPFQKDAQSLSKAFTKTAERLALEYAVPSGPILYNLLSPEIKNGDVQLPHTHHIEPQERFTPELLQGTRSERFLAYRSLVRETFAHSGSILCVVPTSSEIEELANELETGIEDRVIKLSSANTKKQMRDAYEKLEDFSKPKLIVATPTHAILERHDITTTILEHARSPYLKQQVRPYLDYRDVLEVHSYEMGRRFIMGDLLPRTEEEYKRRSDLFQTFGATPTRIDLPGNLEMVEMKDKPDGSIPFKLFSDKVVKAIEETIAEKKNVFLFGARRGLAPVVACSDCGHIFRSPQSGAPYSLIKLFKDGKEERWFVCSTSGSRERAADTCPECGSWRLRERGIGIQYIHEELSKVLQGKPIILFDHTTAKTFKKACFLRDKFYGIKGTVMIGTPMALPYLTKEIGTSIIVNMDALYATPTWRLQEENLALLLGLREVTSGTLYVQTRTKDDALIKQARQASVELFYSEEIELRKTFNYPPFTTFIHLTWQGDRKTVKDMEADIVKKLQGFDVSIYTAPPSPKNTIIAYGLLRIAEKDWPNPKLTTALSTLSPAVRVVKNPDRVV